MSLGTQHFYEFDDFRLDPAERVLMRGGKPVSLTPKAFHLLEILVKNHGHIVEKKKLLSEIWADSFVEEGNLTFNARTLRKILDDDARQPRFIETVARRGYRFVAPVREIFSEEISAPQNALTSRPAQNYFSLAAVFAIAVFLLCAVGGAAWLTRNQDTKTEPTAAPLLSAPFHSEKLTNTGNGTIAVISPDGKFAAYVDKTNDKFGIWLRRLGTAEKLQIVPPSDDFYLGLVFSHDGQSIYFVRLPQTGEKVQSAVYRVSTLGGAPEKIVAATEGWISFSPDDRQISFVRCSNQIDDYCSLFVADANGQNERKIVTRPQPIRIGDNQFSPDGKSIAFAAGESWNGAADFGLEKIDLESGAESELLTRKFFNIKNFKWMPDGKNLLLAAMENLAGRIKIWQVSIPDTGGAAVDARPLTNDAENYESLSLDKDADKIIAAQVTNDFRLYFLSGGAAKALTNADCFDFAPGGKIVYSTFDGDIWTIDREGGGQRQLVGNSFSNFAPRMSPDGRFVYFTSNRTGANQIWRMDAADGGNPTQITNGEGGYPRFVSPDGQWIYYESGLHQTLWKAPTEGGAESQIYNKKVFSPAFSPDGKLFAYFFRDGKIKIGIVNLETGKLVKTFDLANSKSNAVRIAWMNDNLSLEYITKNGLENKLWSQPLDEKTARFLYNLDDGEINAFALSPSDNSVVLTRGQWIHDAVLIDGLK